MFSGLSKLLDKPFVLGFYLPSLMGMIGLMLANRDLEFCKKWIEEGLSGSKGLADLVAVAGGVWIFAVFLMAVNHWSYRLLEGYIWPIKTSRAIRLQQRRRQVQRRQMRLFNAEHERGLLGLEGIQEAAPGSERHIAAEREVNRLYQRFLKAKEWSVRHYPAEPGDVLSTRFGNILRSFEMYSTDIYSADSIHIWPRLLAVIPKDYQDLMVDARSTVDFLVSIVMLSSGIAVVAVSRIVWLWLTHAPELKVLFGDLLIALIASLFVAWLCYQIAISAAGRWGDFVKGAFDLYLPALAQLLGFVLPESAEDQKAFWDEWSSQFRFHDRVDAKQWKRVSPGGVEPKDKGRSKAKGAAGDDDNAEKPDENAAPEPDASCAASLSPPPKD